MQAKKQHELYKGLLSTINIQISQAKNKHNNM